jgi:hypothetical protein
MVLPRTFVRQLARPASSLLRGAPIAPRLACGGASAAFKRTLTASASRQGKVLLVLYDVSSCAHQAPSLPYT